MNSTPPKKFRGEAPKIMPPFSNHGNYDGYRNYNYTVDRLRFQLYACVNVLNISDI